MTLIRTTHKAAPVPKAPSEKMTNDRTPVWMLIGPVLFLIGIGTGAFFSSLTSGISGQLDFLFQTDCRMRLEAPFFSGFLSSMSSFFIFLAVCFLCGLSVWGGFLLPLAPIVRGFGLGLVAGHLYVEYGWLGVLFYSTALLPGAVIGCWGVFFAVQESWNFSRKLFSGSFGKAEKKIMMGRYVTRYGLFFLPCILGAAIDWLTAAAGSLWFFQGLLQ